MSADDHCGHFNALRDMAEAKHGVSISPTHNRAETWDQAETVLKAPLGQEVKSFLGFLADIAANDVLETLVGEKGKMKSTQSCQYRLELRDLSDIDPSIEGISFMETRDHRSYFTILSSHQAFSPCPTANHSLQRYKARQELVRSPYGDVSLISFALRFFGQETTKEGRALITASSDPEAFFAEACRCFGAPADLGVGVYFFEADNVEVLIRPIADIGISLNVLDVRKPSAVSEKLMRLLDVGVEMFRA
ncbi:hypothetical protein P279_12345 [Rhodobacteraceae bacterium PD-2]|nr:hypothetical protein P279_12345 [Rhodobacteraceae bacterium PD-2]